jgi:acyl-CoA synthetase (AMP-forming)/AMP-acid ligase II
MGFLAALTHSSSIVFPSDVFDASLTLDAIAAEQCTTLLGVPTMFIAELSELATKPYKIATLRTGLAAGSMIPAPLLERLNREMGVNDVLIAYGMTETSPVTFMVDSDDPEERRRGLGKVMPHTSAKIVDLQGNIMPRGSRGELCTSGYALMKGYLDNKMGTKEVMRRDENGVLWMHTGDECIIDNEGYCEITGRIKDLIIRGMSISLVQHIVSLTLPGGENIFPAEIEEHLIRHPLICEASVVGLPDDKYGEVVSCFLRVVEGKRKPGEQEVREWISSKLSWQKLPKWVFWIGDKDVGSDFPKTGSGKHQKHILRELGQTLIRKAQLERARL